MVGTKNGFVVTWLTNLNFHFGCDLMKLSAASASATAPIARRSHDRRRHRERGCPEACPLEHLAAVDDHLAPLVGVHALRLWSAEVF